MLKIKAEDVFLDLLLWSRKYSLADGQEQKLYVI